MQQSDVSSAVIPKDPQPFLYEIQNMTYRYVYAILSVAEEKGPVNRRPLYPVKDRRKNAELSNLNNSVAVHP